ncbi:hypothetical protein RMCBS344292_18565 [Rhizopus microsporus]|nr:hypothetical protein RMCBS344292_18565 [Rhizopus microsporus]
MSSFARTHGAAHPHYGHSHTELFQPWFGRAVAKYMVTEYKLTLYPHRDLVIYEMNGGNGRLMPYILDYIRQYEPSVYQRTQYNLIEPTFMSIAHEPLPQHDCPIARFDQSIFDWNRVVTEQCFVLGLEVMTRLGHDMIQSRDNTQYQGLVCIDSQGHHHQLFEPVGNDPLINRYLTFRKKLKTPSSDRAWRQFRLSLANSYEFIPTRLFQLLDILRTYFPGHRLILTDYSHLPHTIEGINAPMVQACYKDRMVRCKTFRLPPGWYDIMFPINFELVKEMYLLMSHKNVKLLSYEDFVERYERTKKRSSNVKILLT